MNVYSYKLGINLICKEINKDILLKFINDSIDVLIYVIDMDTNEILYANKKTQDEFGPVIGNKCYEVLQENIVKQCEYCPSLELKDFLNDDKIYYTWEHHNTINNKTYLFRDIILNLDDRLVKIQLGIDITIEDKLEKGYISEKNHSINPLQALTTTTIEGLIVSDSDGKCIQANETAHEIFGYEQGKLLNENIYDFVFEKSKKLVKQHIQELYKESYEAVLIKKDGSNFPVILRVQEIILDNKILRVFAILDITLIKEKEKKIEVLAYYDSLTSLANRRLLLDRVNQFMKASERSRDYASLMFIDLDHFKVINDLRGHSFGDILLKQCAQRLSGIVRKSDTVSRFGGDEFVVLIDTLTFDEKKAIKQVEVIALKVLEELSQPFIIEGSEFKISASIGMIMFTGTKYSVDYLLKYADNAMYESKKNGRGTYTFFNTKLEEKNERKKLLIHKLTDAISNNLIEFYYQKQMNKNKKVIGVELLARWTDNDLGLIDTNEFISLAIEIGIIEKLDEMVLYKAIELIKTWENNLKKRNWYVSVNVSLKQFEREDFLSLIKETFLNFNMVTDKLIIEVAENIIYKNEDLIVKKVEELNDLGVKLSIEDFATGYFSLPYLKRLSINEIKINKQFIENILDNKNDEIVVLSILEIAKKFNLKVIVEGVETKEIYDKLLAIGCENFQGYYISVPQSL